VFVQVPRSGTLKGFQKNLKWIDRLLPALVQQPAGADARDTVEDGDERATSTADAARILLTALGKRQPDEFIKAASAIGVPLHSTPLSTEDTHAMCMDANIGVNSLNTILRWLKWAGNGRIFASEEAVRRPTLRMESQWRSLIESKLLEIWRSSPSVWAKRACLVSVLAVPTHQGQLESAF
jgi:hypothetical protein